MVALSDFQALFVAPKRYREHHDLDFQEKLSAFSHRARKPKVLFHPKVKRQYACASPIDQIDQPHADPWNESYKQLHYDHCDAEHPNFAKNGLYRNA